MIELRTLGPLHLRDADGRELTSVLSQPKRLALLAYLAIATPRGLHRRDKLVALFWPESDQLHARTSLRKAVHGLRQALGESAIIARGDEEVGLDLDVICCDAVLFEEAVAVPCRQEEALALYAGELLDGLHIAASTEFEHWLEGERERIRRHAQQAAHALAGRAEARGDSAGALRWLERALDFYPDDEPIMQDLVRLRDRLGDRAGAVREYDRFARRLARELDVEPSPESLALVRGIRARVDGDGRLASRAQDRPEPTVLTASDSPGRPDARVRLTVRRRVALAVVCIAVIAGAAAGLRRRAHPGTAPTSGRVVAVFPFRVAAADSSLAFLREGMVDLLAVKLSGTGYMRTVDPQTLLGAWERAGGTSRRDLDRAHALSLARRFGAGWLLQGSVTGTAQRVVLSATLVDSVGQEHMSASLDGPYDSLISVVDRLAAQLLALSAGEPRQRLTALTTTTLPALRAYLEGRASYRRGSFGNAVTDFALAMQLDTTFALAGLGRTEAAKWDRDRQPDGPGSLLAWRYRARLSERDQAFLYAIVGPRFPRVSSVRQLLHAAEDKVLAAPDSPEARAALGDFLYHYGPELGLRDAHARSLRAFETALSFDSLYAPALEHLGPLYAETGDTSAVRRSLARLLELDSVSSQSAANRFYASFVLDDEALRRGHRDQDSLLSQAGWLASMVGENGVARDVVDSLIGIRERSGGARVATYYYLMRGWPQRARQVAFEPDDISLRAHLLLMLAYTDGDSAQARTVARGLHSLLSRPLRGFEEEEALFSLAQYELACGRPAMARTVSAKLRRIREQEAPLGYGYVAPYFALLLETQLDALAGGPNLAARVETLDTVLQGVPMSGILTIVGNLVTARLWERQGEHRRALDAIRRRRQNDGFEPIWVAYAREEGRIAARAGDLSGARRAYQHYLMLRTQAEPPVRIQVDSVRKELADLEKSRAALP